MKNPSFHVVTKLWYPTALTALKPRGILFINLLPCCRIVLTIILPSSGVTVFNLCFFMSAMDSSIPFSEFFTCPFFTLHDSCNDILLPFSQTVSDALSSFVNGSRAGLPFLNRLATVSADSPLVCPYIEYHH